MYKIAGELTSTVFHIAFAWLPNLYLLGRMSSPSNSFDNTIADWVWAGLLASMTPFAVVSIALSLGLYYFS